MFRFDFFEPEAAGGASGGPPEDEAAAGDAARETSRIACELVPARESLGTGPCSTLTLACGHSVLLVSEGAGAREIGPSDIVPGEYEGGFKLWECALDLSNFLASLESLPCARVLELGSGKGVPGLVCLQRGAEVVFQDLNREVLEGITIPQVSANCSPVVMSRARFLSGDWKSVLDFDLPPFDLIISSETIYTPFGMEMLLRLMERFLSAEGTVFLAAKRYYFGLGGGAQPFREALQRDGRFACTTVAEFNDHKSNIREILRIRRCPGAC